MVYDKFSRAIIKLKHDERVHLLSSNKLKTNVIPDGTAFLLSKKNDLFVVSARHVVDKNYDLYANVKAKDSETGVIKDLLLKLPRHSWVYHPDQGNENTHYVDVAVMKISLLPGHELVAFEYSPQWGNTVDYTSHKQRTPLPVLICGFSGNKGFRLSQARPISTLGIIPAFKDNSKSFKIKNGKFVENKAFLIDAEISGGNSGSPVFQPAPPLFFRNDMRIIGLVIGADESMDLAIVEPASRIWETLDLAEKRSGKDYTFWFGLTR
ncbi:MAG: serine protease [Desulfobacterales bacterium]|nr:serine protease [Desulfobacterales bacterium]